MDIACRARVLIAEHLGNAALDAPDGARFVEDLHAASLDLVELIMSVEDEFGVDIPDAASERFVTIADVVSFLETTLAGPSSRGIEGRPVI